MLQFQDQLEESAEEDSRLRERGGDGSQQSGGNRSLAQAYGESLVRLFCACH